MDCEGIKELLDRVKGYSHGFLNFG
jgi:hypothetical protein